MLSPTRTLANEKCGSAMLVPRLMAVGGTSFLGDPHPRLVRRSSVFTSRFQEHWGLVDGGLASHSLSASQASDPGLWSGPAHTERFRRG